MNDPSRGNHRPTGEGWDSPKLQQLSPCRSVVCLLPIQHVDNINTKQLLFKQLYNATANLKLLVKQTFFAEFRE
jgi:hypothetical protein